MGRQLISHILEIAGVRIPKKRGRRTPDEMATRGAFDTFFPGAQWVGDGKQVRVTIGNETFTLNLELNVDAHSGALVGLSVSDEEDSAVVTECFNQAVATTEAAPLAQLLDNKPSNHTAEVEATLASHDTLRIRATTKRPENKAHVEGAFGLFSQQVPPITLETSQNSRGIAKALLFLVAMTWARATNFRPRADHKGCTRVDLYDEKPSDEQIAAARAALEERCRKQELARRTLAARQRPEVRALLDEHFQRLGLADPERHVRLAIGRYPLDAIIDGIAIFDAKSRCGSLPDGADARYLFGIVKNVAAKAEGEALAKTLLALRLETKDKELARLSTARENLCCLQRDDRELIKDCVERAFETERSLDRNFWLTSISQEICKRSLGDASKRDTLYFVATKKINTTFSVPPRERQDALRMIADNLIPLG